MAKRTRRDSTAVIALRPYPASRINHSLSEDSAPPLSGWQLLVAAFQGYDGRLLVIVGSLIALGIVMVYSSSFSYAYLFFEKSEYFLIRQIMWTVIGVAVLLVFMRIPYEFWRRMAVPILFLALVALAMPLLLKNVRFGAAQSLLSSGSIQPSEAAKLALVIYNAAWLASRRDRLREIRSGLIPYAIILAVVDGLIIMEPDFGTATLVVMIAAAMFFIAGADIKQLLVGSIVCGTTLAFFIWRSEHALQRVTDFVTTLKDPLNGGSYQVQQAVRALAAGGFLGQGIGQSQLKQPGGVPLPWSDTIFAIVGSEMGLLGTLLVVGLFLALAYRGLIIALSVQNRSQNQFGVLLAAGITLWLSFQAMINIAVVTATAPLTGLTLPFISFGGSSLVVSMAGVGILLSISKAANQRTDDDAPVSFGRGDRRTRVSVGSGSTSAVATVRRYEQSIPTRGRERPRQSRRTLHR